MNLEESNSFVEKMEKNDRNKKKVLTVMVICAILVVILLIMIFYIKYQDSLKLKVYVDNKQVAISSNLLVNEENDTYINIKSLSDMLGYSYQNGEYKEYNEDEKSCYIKNQYEVVSMSANSNTVTKYILNKETKFNENSDESDQNKDKNSNSSNQLMSNIVVESKNETSEIFDINVPIKYINNELYVSFNEMQRLFNVVLDTSVNNRIRIYSLNYLIQISLNTASKYGYKEVSNIYENCTAMVDGMLIVGDGSNFGVISLNDGHEIISLKYEKLVYMQNTKEFFVTAEGAKGIVSSEGITIVKPTEYDDIHNLDQLNKLYLVQKNGKYGVINGDGDTIVYPEYDSIGIPNPEDFSKEEIRNFNLLFDKCIPVELGGKYGIIDIDGEERLKCVNNGLGYVTNIASTSNNYNNKTNTTNTTNSTNTTNDINNSSNTINSNEYDNVLLIPESIGIKGIVVNYDGHYGLYDANVGRLIIPSVCSKIYSKTKSGETKYYIEYNEQEIELESYLDQEGLKSSNKENINEETQNDIDE